MSRFITKLVVIAVVIGVLLAAAGVLHFRNGTDQTSVTLDKKELKEKTRDVVGKTEEVGGKILDKTGEGAGTRRPRRCAVRRVMGGPRNRRRPARRARDDGAAILKFRRTELSSSSPKAWTNWKVRPTCLVEQTAPPFAVLRKPARLAVFLSVPHRR